MLEAPEELPPSSRTPVIFATEAGPPSSRRRSVPLSHRLAPLALLPVLVAALGFVVLRGRAAEGASGDRVQAAVPSAERPFAPEARAGESGAAGEVSLPSAEGGDLLEEVNPCRPEMALVIDGATRVCVDRWEASLVELTKNGERRSHSPYITPNTASGRKYVALSAPGVVPQAYVSKHQAALACKNAGKRLCSGVEWRAACEGSTHTTYPYGEREDRGACNTHGNNPLPMLLGSSKRFMWGRAMHHPLLNTFPGTLAKTGAFERCANDYGLHDMVGNLHEWTADGDFRGGYYRDDRSNSPGCRYRTTAHGPTYSDYSTGFRCCADPE